MPRLLIGAASAVVLCAGLAALASAADAKANQSREGVVDRIEVQDEQTGTVRLRPDKDLPRYVFKITKETKILTDKADPLEGGLKSPLLKGAQVRVVFVEKDGKADKADQEAVRVCRSLQILKPAK